MSESKRPARRAIPAGPAPTETSLREAALAHLARFASTESSLRAVLRRRVDRWALRARDEGLAEEQIARARADGRRAADAVAARMTELGAVNDQAFAESRARRLRRAGRSAQAIAAHLAAKGVSRALVDPALDAAPGEDLDAAVAFLRRRRAGPFGETPADEMDAVARQKLFAAMGRAGFEHETARRALNLSREEAEERLNATRGA